nr:hypothetical protein [Desulfobulbaceae bacterium]
MKGILAGVFIGVFFGALGYEILNRTNPKMVDAIRRRVSDNVDKFMDPNNDLDEDYDDMDMDQEPSQA